MTIDKKRYTSYAQKVEMRRAAAYYWCLLQINRRDIISIYHKHDGEGSIL